MIKLKRIVDFEGVSSSHVDLVIGQATATEIPTAYLNHTGVKVVLVNVTVNTSQKTIDAIVLSGKPHLLYIDKSPCIGSQELYTKIETEGYLNTLLDSVNGAYRLYSPYDAYLLAA